jgi:hypothetical protein
MFWPDTEVQMFSIGTFVVSGIRRSFCVPLGIPFGLNLTDMLESLDRMYESQSKHHFVREQNNCEH